MTEKTDDLIISISTDMATVRRSLKKLEADIASTSGVVVKQFDAMGKGMDRSITTAMQTRINAMVGIGSKAAKEWNGALADQGKELERIRAKYNPLFATINAYKANIVDIKRAHAIGALSSAEYQAAMSKERQAALAATAAIKGRNAAIEAAPQTSSRQSSQGFQTANIAAQFQDIAVTSAMGMSPLQIALQQGTQLSSVLGPMGATGAVKGLGAAFLSVVSPVSLVTIGIVAASAAAIQWAFSTESGAEKASKALKSHGDFIRSLKQDYGEAANGLEDYVRRSQQEVAAAGRANLELQKEVAKEAATELVDSISPSGGLFGRLGIDPQFEPFRKAILDLRESVNNGRPDFAAFRAEIERRIETTGMKAAGDALLNNAKAAMDAQRTVNSAQAAMETLGEVAGRQATGVHNLAEAMRDLAGIAMPNLTDLERAQNAYAKALGVARTREEKDDVYAQFRETVNRIGNQNPTVANADGRTVAVPIPGQKPVQLGEASAKPDRAIKSAADAYRDLLKSADDRLGQMALEQQLIGKTGVAADTLRFKLDLLQQSEDKGRSLSEGQRAEIDKKVEAYNRYANALAKASLQQDLMFEREQLGRSAQDQQVASRLKSYGLPVDLNSQEAQQIRAMEQYKGAREELSGFFTDLRSGMLDDGKSIGESFADALKNAMTNRLNKLSDSLIDSFVTSILGNGTGSGGVIGKYLGMNGGAANDNFQTNTTLDGFLGLGGSAGGSVAGGSGTGGAVDKAMALLGANEHKQNSDINSFLKRGGVNIDAAQTAWCAGFVNSSLKQVGVDGTGKLNANSFLNWGQGIGASQAMKGDVLVQARGLGADQTGGHVGFATGLSRIKEGQQQLEMLSGNSSHNVAKTWVDANELQVRRSTDASNALEKLGGSGSAAAGNLAGLQGAAGNAISSLGNLGSGMNQFSQQLMNASQGGTGGGGLFSNLLGGLGRMVGGISPTSALWRPNTTLGGFLTNGYDKGGYTGPGGKYEPAGIVHKGEFVMNAEATRRIGVSTLAKLQGYASGGLVGAPAMPLLDIPTPVAPTLRSGSGSGSGGGVHVTVGVSVDKNGNLDAYVKSIAQAEASSAASQTVQSFSDNALPYRMQEINQNPRMVG